MHLVDHQAVPQHRRSSVEMAPILHPSASQALRCHVLMQDNEQFHSHPDNIAHAVANAPSWAAYDGYAGLTVGSHHQASANHRHGHESSLAGHQGPHGHAYGASWLGKGHALHQAVAVNMAGQVCALLSPLSESSSGLNLDAIGVTSFSPIDSSIR